MSTTATQTDQSVQEWFQYLRDTLPKLGERDRQVVVALIKAFYHGTLSVEEYDEVGRGGVEALLVERGLLDVEAQR